MHFLSLTEHVTTNVLSKKCLLQFSVVMRRCGRRGRRGLLRWRRPSRSKRAKFSPLGRYEARIARVTITARPAIFMPAVTKLPDIIPSHWVRKAQIKPTLYWTIFLESGGEICSLLDKEPRRLRYEIRKELHILKSWASSFSALG